jgi:membrane fusion protein, multidrug efflux system
LCNDTIGCEGNKVMKKIVLAITTAALLLGVMALAACSSKHDAATPAPEVVRDIALQQVASAKLPDNIEAVGTVRAAESAQVAAQMMGTVLAVNAREGDHVKRGQVLVVVDSAQPQAGLDRARAAANGADHEAAAAHADYALALTTMKRYQDLYDKKAVSPQEFDEVKARLQSATARRDMAHAGQAQAKAALAQASTSLDYTRVRAPFDGVVTEKRVDAGAMATPGTPLLTIEKSGRYRLEASVDESSLRVVKLGQATKVSLDALGGGELPGKVVEIVPSADPGTHSFVVRIELPADAQLRSGLFGRAYFPRGERESLIIPRTAVVERGQLQGVYVVGPDQVASLRYVTLGKSAGDAVEVLSGLRAGDKLVSAPGVRDLGGKKIE